ncbi:MULTISPECIES: hypothetical protein [Bacillus cereus group]|uniref:hypothetical protein n=1 Tax=Bacillus cereus group TaxID=86661 RepID=UPI000BF5EFFD|nr:MULTISPECIES: hypothetical protein [Bacillus cereus group]PFI72436.1 hypothetical protein COI83_30915 [Bacillus cereus]
MEKNSKVILLKDWRNAKKARLLTSDDIASLIQHSIQMNRLTRVGENLNLIVVYIVISIFPILFILGFWYEKAL